ncbi:hypothetical protein D3P09_09225 [Paenibacillus pinisoli]|uniref:Uncharacterized protein n=1 Tax=Paenibacillus pinisoli TaxID=1276110 RepID=A0A3A6PIS2_9BACL|nr:hypothetical protein [Paenibacillus pinisoli]RJX39586.1 hypothetical protein D3P09_09225 [Paenibacillus pinisoli]
MLRWQVRVLAKKMDTYKVLSNHFKSSSLNFILDEYGCCYMQSDNFNSFADDGYVEDVQDIANNYVKLINGMMTVNLNLENDSLSTQEIVVQYKDGKKKAFMYNSDTYDLQGRVNIRTDLNHDERLENKPAKWIELAFNEEKVNQALSIIRFGLNDAVVMYKVYEIIRDDLTRTFTTGKKRPRDLFVNIDPKYTDQEVSTFTGSVNDVRVLGDNARHAEDRSNNGVMKRSMTREECKDFIYELFYRWMHYKQNKEKYI